MHTLSFAMNVSLDGHIAASDGDLGWGAPSDELVQWWSDRVATTEVALYGRRLWQAMSAHRPTADQQPGATPAQIEYAGRWRDLTQVVFSSTLGGVEGSARLVTGARRSWSAAARRTSPASTTRCTSTWSRPARSRAA